MPSKNNEVNKKLIYIYNLILYTNIFWIIAKFGYVLTDQSWVFLQKNPTRIGHFDYYKNSVIGIL